MDNILELDDECMPDIREEKKEETPDVVTKYKSTIDSFASKNIIPKVLSQHCMQFYDTPTAKIFNKIIEDEKLDMVYDKYEDDFRYVQFEDEDDKAFRARIRISSTPSKVMYTDSMLLSWIDAVINAHPQLVVECNNPLLIERTQSFMQNSMVKIQSAMAALFDEKYSKDLRSHIRFTCIDNFFKYYVLTFIIKYLASRDQQYLDEILKYVDDIQCHLTTNRRNPKSLVSLCIQDVNGEVKNMIDDILTSILNGPETLKGI
jgi:hypothetical protein